MASYPVGASGALHHPRGQLGPAPNPSKASYPAFDALRGIAAILVVLYHAEYILGFALVPNGYLAVDLFFALSGFVIAHAYDARLAAGMGVGRFALMRMLRFWPLYLLGLALGVAVQGLYLAIGHDPAMKPWQIVAAIGSNAVFVPALFPTYGNTLFPLNVVSWSLFFELVVNILYACLLPWLSRRVVGGIALVSGVGFAVAALLYGTTNVGWSSTEVWLGLLRTIFSFSAGVWLFRADIALPRVPLWLLMAVVTLFLSLPVSDAGRPVLTLLFILLVSPLMVAAGARVEVPPRAAAFATLLGALSYPLYAIHKPLLSFANLAGKAADAPGPLVVALYMAGVCGLCLLLDRWFDRPLRRHFSVRMGRRTLSPA